MAYIANPDSDNSRQEIVRVEVIYLDYDDGIDNLQNSGEQNFNALEFEDSDKIAIGVVSAENTQTAIDDLPSGGIQYAGYYLGQNRIRTMVTGIPIPEDFIAKENNIPTMTLSFDFGDNADPLGSFRIDNARLKADTDPEEMTPNRIRADVTMDISGIIDSLPTSSDQNFEGEITQLDINGELNLLFNRGQENEQSMRIGTTQRFYSTQNEANTNEANTRATFAPATDNGANGANDLIGRFFNDGPSLAHIVAGTVDSDLVTI